MSEEYEPTPRKRGRPSNAEIAARAELAENTEPVPSKRAEETRRQRRRRSDSGRFAGMKLQVPEQYKDPRFTYRWINDDADFSQDGDRIGMRMHAKTVLDDWDQVMADSGVEGQGEGTPVKRLVGKGEGGRPIYAHLCRKPKDWYDQDKAQEQEAISRREEDMRRGAPAGPEGLHGSTAYVPEGGIKIGRGV